MLGSFDCVIVSINRLSFLPTNYYDWYHKSFNSSLLVRQHFDIAAAPFAATHAIFFEDTPKSRNEEVENKSLDTLSLGCPSPLRCYGYSHDKSWKSPQACYPANPLTCSDFAVSHTLFYAFM